MKRCCRSGRYPAALAGALFFLILLSYGCGSSEKVLYVDGLDWVRVAVDENSFDDLLDASMANDTSRIMQMVSSGRVFMVRNNTKVIVLKTRLPGRVKIEVAEGDKAGMSGWVPVEWVRSVPKGTTAAADATAEPKAAGQSPEPPKPEPPEPISSSDELYGIVPSGNNLTCSEVTYLAGPAGRYRYYNIVAVSRRPDKPYAYHVNQIVVCRFDEGQGRWLGIWKSEPIEGETPYQELLLTEPGGPVILCASECGIGVTGASIAIVFAVEADGSVELLYHDNIGHGTLVREGNSVTITEEGNGRRIFTVDQGRVVDRQLKRSEMAPAGAVKATFTLKLTLRGYEVLPVGDKVISVKVGQTVAFVPDEKAAPSFDRSEINIYSDAWNGPPLDLSEADRLKSENYYTFESTGTFNFLLIHRGEEVLGNKREITPTFVVVVEP